MVPANHRKRSLLRATNRFGTALVFGLVGAAVLPGNWSLTLRAVVGWDTFATVLLGVVGTMVIRSTPAQTRMRAASADPGRTLVYALVLGASLISLGAATLLARKANADTVRHAQVLFPLCVFAVMSSWALTHASFTLRYAHLYYRGDAVGGLQFPGEDTPDDFDFAYFAFTIGMCFQVSDVTICTREIRRTVLLHALISFVYNTSILALALNLIFGRLG